MAQPIVVVKENPPSLVVEVREKKGSSETLIAVLRLPEVHVKLQDGAKINGAPVSACAEYRLALAETGVSARKARKKAKRKAPRKGKKKSGK